MEIFKKSMKSDFYYLIFALAYNYFSFFYRRVMTRKIPSVNVIKKPSVIMKLDIEGSELEVLIDLVTLL